MTVDAVHLHLGKEVGEGQLVFRQRLEQALFDAARHVDRIDHHHVPVAGLRLLDDRQSGAGALEFLDVDLDVVGLLERLQQRRIGVIAPDQGVEIRSPARLPVASSSAVAAHAARRRVFRTDSGFVDADGHRVFSLAFVASRKKLNEF